MKYLYQIVLSGAMVLVGETAFAISFAPMQCIGNDFEQQTPIDGVTLPTVKATVNSTSVKEGQAARLSAQATVDSRGQASYYWCAEKGTLVKASQDYQTVWYFAPLVAQDTPIKIMTKVGDSLGYVNSALLEITVQKQPLAISYPDNTGTVQIIGNPALTNQSKILVNRVPVAVQSTNTGISFNPYQNSSSFHPVYLEISDNTGKNLYNGCYPFLDVCPAHWYSVPIVKLWSKQIVQGYDNGTSHLFGTYDLATRAEAVAMTGRATNKLVPNITTFEDVKLTDYYAGYAEYANQQGWIKSCNLQRNLFCPNDFISRAYVAKILTLAFPERFANSLTKCQTAISSFKDMDNTAPYHPYICALAEQLGQIGYPDGTFRPDHYITRAELAKLVCSATFGASECIESGDLNRPMILSVSPSTGTVNQLVTLSIEGFHLPQPLKLNLPNCQNIQYVSGGNTEKQQFTCTPTVAGQLQGQVLDNNSTELFKFTLNIQGVTTPNPPPTDTTTPPPPVTQDLPVEMAGNETSSFLLSDNSIANSCTFTDIDQTAIYAQPVNLFCSAAILIGYSVEGQRVFKPNNAATLVEVLKVLLFANDYRHIGETLPLDNTWVDFIINEAKTKGLDLGILTKNDLIKRRQAMMWVAQLFYNYTGSDPITFLKTKGITNGDRPDDNVTRSEIVLLAYRSVNDTGRYIHYGLVGSPPPALPTSGLAQAIANAALKAIGTKYPYVDSKYTYSARFVRMMFEKPAVWSDAKTMCGFYTSKGVLKNTQNPPIGAVVCYNPSSINGNYGHVAIAVGDGNEVGVTSLSAGVSKRSIVYGSSYQGWISADDFNSQYP